MTTSVSKNVYRLMTMRLVALTFEVLDVMGSPVRNNAQNRKTNKVRNERTLISFDFLKGTICGLCAFMLPILTTKLPTKMMSVVSFPRDVPCGITPLIWNKETVKILIKRHTIHPFFESRAWFQSRSPPILFAK